jgi:hypothetical protein
MQEPVRLTRSPTTVPPQPGLETLPCFNSEGGGGACTIDVAARRLTPVALPTYGLVDWSPQTDGGFWGVTRRDLMAWTPGSLVVQNPSGKFEERRLGGAGLVVPLNVPEGTVAVFSHYSGNVAGLSGWHNLPILGLLHVSNDRGQTWRTYDVPTGVPGALDSNFYVTYVPELPDSWESWPEFKP